MQEKTGGPIQMGMKNGMVHEILGQKVREHMHAVNTVVRADATVANAIKRLRDEKVERPITYLYVVDNWEKMRLVGVLPTRKLLLADSEDVMVGDLMVCAVTSLRDDMTMREALHKFDTSRYLALPVVNKNGKFLGAIDVSAFMDDAEGMGEMERIEDTFQIIGMRVQQVEQGNVLKGYGLRMPWLFVNIAGGLICAGIATVFSHVLDKVVVLAAFIPLVLALNESISIQSLTISLQQMGGIKESMQRLIREFIKEWKTAGMLAITSGFVVGIASIFWPGNYMPPLVIGGEYFGEHDCERVIRTHGA